VPSSTIAPTLIPADARQLMSLTVLLPSRVLVEQDRVRRIIAETSHGSFGIWPQRLDCMAALTPGILTFEAEAQGLAYLAVDAGVLVKAGRRVWVSVRNAIAGADLGRLRERIESEMSHHDERERDLRSTLAKMEGMLLRRLAEFRHE